MGLIELYILFALTTSITCCILFFLPLIGEAKSEGIENEFTKYPIMSAIIYLVIGCIMAPFLILPILFESKAEQFRRGLRTSIFAKD
jgi:hypothetical protein